MYRRITALVMLLAAAAAYPNDALAAGRLAAYRAARTAAAEAALTTAALQPTAPVQPMAPAIAPTMAAPAACCPQPCLIYRHRGHHRACCGCAPPVETVLTATNPCTCCPVCIPVCLPACCQCAPTVSCHGGLLCAGVVDFDWSCGYRVSVRFKHNGEVVVVSRG